MKVGRIISVFLVLLVVGGLSCPVLAVDDELPVDLNVTIVELRPDIAKSLAEEVATQTKVLMGKMADMFKMEITVYQIEGDIETVLQDQSWPPDTTLTPVQSESLDRTIKRLLKDTEEFEAAWGAGWANQAQKAANKYSEIELRTKAIVLPPDSESLTTYSITVSTPFVSMRSFEMYEGLFLIITKMEISL